MQIPHEVSARPDTGLYNAKLGIWLFLASEVMLFGGLFSGYLFLRLGAEDGYWPHGLLNVPVGTFNTAVLIVSSVTIVFTWANLKMRRFAIAQRYLLATILCGALFLVVKLAYEYPDKFQHFGAFIKKESLPKYEQFLGNKHLAERGAPQRVEITGHLEAPEKYKALHGQHLIEAVLNDQDIHELEVEVDAVNADPTAPANDRAHFWPRARPGDVARKSGMSEHEMEAKGFIAKIAKEDIEWASAFAPKHSSYFAIYFTITGLHGAHVLGGVLVMLYFYFFGHEIYRRNPEHQANRIEVVGLFWHFVDLVWIFVFPIFYLL
jgi:cytochrome c oxidase subunit 3